jgi:uncharacterized protein DUF3313
MKRVSLSLCVMLFGLILLSTGCAAPGEPSGFLGDYEGFVPGPEGIDLVWRKPGLDLSSYDKVLIERAVVYLDKDSLERAIDPTELKQLTDYFEQALVAALKGAYPIVAEPGPGVLRVRTAITNLKAGSPVTHGTTSIIPVGFVASAVNAAITGTHFGVGEATIEAEFLDGATGERLAAAVDRKVGRKIQFGSGFAKWGHVKSAFDFWAKRLRQRLDEDRK